MQRIRSIASVSLRRRLAGIPDAIPYPAFVLLGSCLAFTVVVLCFTPRFALWRGLDAGVGLFNPEINRAHDTLLQIVDPFAPVENKTNRVISWRLLFPAVVHTLNVPDWLYLILPQLGCLLCLGFLTHLFMRESGNRLTTLAGSTLLATTSWFFTSTGWLAYFDSWYVLGLLVVAFVESRRITVAACLLTPWVDERFVIAVPLALAVRSIGFREGGRRSRHELQRDGLVCVAALLPTIAVRIAAAASGDAAGSVGYLREVRDNFPDSPLTYLVGAWHGLRAAWVPVFAFLFFSVDKKTPLASGALVVVTVGTLLAGLVVAGDTSRSMSQLLPAAAMGCILIVRNTTHASPVIALLLAFNLLAPAYHVMTKFRIRIHPIREEISRAQNPPGYLTPDYQNQLAVQSIVDGNWQRAWRHLDAARALDRDLCEATLRRGTAPREIGDSKRALEAFTRALVGKPDDWPHRARVEAWIRDLQNGMHRRPTPRSSRP